MKGYKAFGKGMVCLNKQYAENTVFEEEEADVCRKGMHFCKNPMDCLEYYPLIDDAGNVVEIAEVEALDECKTDDNKKFCTKKLKVGAKVGIKGLVDGFIGFVKEETKIESGGDDVQQVGGDDVQQVGGNASKQVGGDDVQQIGGNASKQVGGDDVQQAGGNYVQQVGGNASKQIGGYASKQVGGDDVQQIGGNYVQQIGGNYVQQVGGNASKQIGGYASKQVGGDDAILINGVGSKFKAGIRSIVVCYEYISGMLQEPVVIRIDGEKYKPDTWYTLKNGKVVKAE